MVTRQIGKYVWSISTKTHMICVTDFDNYKVTIYDYYGGLEEYKGDIICDTAEDADKVIRELAKIYSEQEDKIYD